MPDPNSKKRKIEGQQGDYSLEKLVSIGTNDVGSINPVQDFKDMLGRRDVDLVEKAVDHILHLFPFLLHTLSLVPLYYHRG